MNVYEVRKTRLRQLIDIKFAGNVKRCAEALDMKPPQLHRWLSTTSKDKRRIEFDSARNIEDRLGLRKNWLDSDDRDTNHGSTNVNAGDVAATPNSSGITRRQVHEIPILTYGDIMENKHTSDHPPTDATTVSVSTTDFSTRCFAVRLEDNSMQHYSPPLTRGMTLIFDPDAPATNESAALIHEPGGEVEVREVVVDGGATYVRVPGSQIPPRAILDEHIIGIAKGFYGLLPARAKP